MTVFRDLSLVWSLFHVLILFMLLYRSRYSRRKTFILTGFVMGPLVLLNVAGVMIYGTGVMGRSFLLTCTLPSLLFFWFISKDKKGKFFFTFCLADTVALWIMAVTNVVDFYIGGQQYLLMLIGRLVLFPLAEWFAIRYLRKPYLELQESIASGWGIFAGMTALYYLLLVVIANFPEVITSRPEEFPAFVLVLLLMPMTYATIFVAMYRQLLLYRKQQSDRVLQEQKVQLMAQLENQQRIRKVKHDMKAYAITLSGLLTAGRTEKALAYLNNIRSEMETVQGQFCANVYLNAIFSYYFQKFQEMGIELRLDIQVGDEELPYMELSQIVSNGLENALDASGALNGEEREASVQMKYNRDYLIIRIKNRCGEDLLVEKGTIQGTSKKEAGHGFGLLTVQEAAERLNGEVFCYTENGNFVLDVMVQVNH